MKIVCIGDGWTDATWASATNQAIYKEHVSAEKHWTSLMANELKYTVINKGIFNNTSTDIKNRFANDVVAQKPVLCTILCGYNDIVNSVAVDTIIANLSSMIDTCTVNYIIPVLLSYPVAFNNTTLSTKINELHTKTLDLATKKNTVCIDLFNSKLLDNNVQVADCYLSDMVYPSINGNRIIASKIEYVISNMRALRLERLRNALSAELSRRGQSSITYTDTKVLGLPQKAIHINEIRNKLNTITTKAYTDVPIVPDRTIKKDIHISEIEDIITLLASQPKVGGSTTCNAACTGLCVSCTGTCTGGCTSCTGNCTSNCASHCANHCSNFCQSSCSSGCRMHEYNAS